MMACVLRFVAVTPQLICRFTGLAERKESITGSSSPACVPTAAQSIVRPSSRGGVPVFSLPSGSANSSTRSASRTDAASPIRPAGRVSCPIWITPRRKVPVVSTTAGARTSAPSASTTPATAPFSTIRSTTSPGTSQTSVASTACRIAARYRPRSAWVRGPCAAGPLLRLSSRNWIPAWSAAQPMTPSKASISRTMWPFPRPPMAGLHDISPSRSIRWVTSAVRAPRLLAASAASVPAWPPPTTMTSKSRCFT